VDLERITDDLYGLNPSEFTVARDAWAAEARKSRDRATADSLKRLRKPSVGAWLANQLARQRPADVENLITLGGQLRAAQDRLDGEKIRRLSKSRNEAVASLLREAGSLAGQSGQVVSASATEDLEGTLNAALVDPEAAELVRRGRLTTALHYSGLGPGGLGDGMRDGGSTGRGLDQARDTANRRPARDAVASAQRELEKANREVARGEAEVEEAGRKVAAAETTLKEARSAATLAVRRVRAAQKSAAAAQKRLEAARGKLRT
jgi:hypothetical protein